MELAVLVFGVLTDGEQKKNIRSRESSVMETATRKLAERLDEAFEYSAIWYLEKADHTGEELTDEEGRNVDLFCALQEFIKEVSPALMQDAADLASKYPELFEQSLTTLVSSICDQFRPATATEFVVQLNTFIRRSTEALVPG